MEIILRIKSDKSKNKLQSDKTTDAKTNVCMWKSEKLESSADNLRYIWNIYTFFDRYDTYGISWEIYKIIEYKVKRSHRNAHEDPKFISSLTHTNSRASKEIPV